MSYAQTLNVLAQLQLDRPFRVAFLANPAAALAPFDLEPEECRALCRLLPRAIERMGQMAEWHRAQRIQEHVPWFDLNRWPQLDVYWVAFAACTQPQRINRQEAVAFCRYIEQAAQVEPAYLRDLARYDRVRIELSWMSPAPERTARTERFAYPVEAIRAELAHSQKPEVLGWPACAAAETFLTFRKVPNLPAVVITIAAGPDR